MIQPTVAGLVNPTSLTMVGPKKVSVELARMMQKKMAMNCQTLGVAQRSHDPVLAVAQRCPVALKILLDQTLLLLG